MGEPIKVVILVDGVSVKKWVADSISWVSNSKDFEIKGVVLNTAVNSSKSSFFYRLLRWLDRKLFKAKSNPFFY